MRAWPSMSGSTHVATGGLLFTSGLVWIIAPPPNIQSRSDFGRVHTSISFASESGTLASSCFMMLFISTVRPVIKQGIYQPLHEAPVNCLWVFCHCFFSWIVKSSKMFWSILLTKFVGYPIVLPGAAAPGFHSMPYHSQWPRRSVLSNSVSGGQCQLTESHHPQEVLLVQFRLYVHTSGLKPDSFHF